MQVHFLTFSFHLIFSYYIKPPFFSFPFRVFYFNIFLLPLFFHYQTWCKSQGSKFQFPLRVAVVGPFLFPPRGRPKRWLYWETTVGATSWLGSWRRAACGGLGLATPSTPTFSLISTPQPLGKPS